MIIERTLPRALESHPETSKSSGKVVLDSPDVYAELFCNFDIRNAVVTAHPEDSAALGRHSLDRAVDEKL